MADLTMLASLYIVFAIQVMIAKGWIPIRLSPYLRHTFQFCLVGGSIYYSRQQGWYYIQNCCLLMHTLSMYMKVHSYSSMNEKMCLAWQQKGKPQKGVLMPKESVGKLTFLERWTGANLTYYPHNLTVTNFSRYLITPVLTYQLNFPQTKR